MISTSRQITTRRTASVFQFIYCGLQFSTRFLHVRRYLRDCGLSRRHERQYIHWTWLSSSRGISNNTLLCFALFSKWNSNL